MAITIQDILPHVARCREVLDARKSGVLGDRQSESLGISMLKEGTIRRVWDGLPSKDIYIFKAFLDFYTDAQNCGDGGEILSRYIDDPKIGDGHNGKIVAPGRYRGAYTIIRPQADDNYLLIQELRLGWIESLVNGGTVDYSEARIESVDWYNPNNPANPNQDYITLVWKGISPYKADSIVESLKALPADGWTPTVNEQPLIAHHRLLVRSAEEQDGSASIRILLANSTLTFETYSAWQTDRQTNVTNHFNVPTDMVLALVEAEKAKGVSVRVGGPDQRGLHDVIVEQSNPNQPSINRATQNACSFNVFSEYRFGVAEADIPNATSEKGTIQTIRIQSRGDGLYDVVIETRKTTETNISEYTAESSAGRDVKRSERRGYTGTDSSRNAAQGEITRVSISINQDCSKDAVTETIISKEQSGEDRRYTKNSDVTGTLTTNKKILPSPPTAQPGQTITYQKRPNIDGTFDVTQRIDVSPSLDNYEQVATQNRTNNSKGSENDRAKKITPSKSPAAGETIRFRSKQNEDDTYSWTETIEISPRLVNYEKINTPLRQSKGTGVENDRTQQTTPKTKPTAGQTVRFRSRQNDDNTYSWNEVVESAINDQESEVKEMASCRDISTTTIKRNIISGKPDLTKEKPTEPGTIVTTRLVENDDGSYDTEIRKQNAPALKGDRKLFKAKKATVISEVYRNQKPGAVKEPAGSELERTRVTYDRNDNLDCTEDVTITRDKIEMYTDEVMEFSYLEDSEVVSIRNDDKPILIPSSFTEGKTEQYENRETEEGLFNTNKIIRTAKKGGREYKYNSRGGEIEITIIRNWTEEDVENKIASLQVDKINTVSVEPNRYGLYDGSITVSPAKYNWSSTGNDDPDDIPPYSLTVDGVIYTIAVKYTRSEAKASEFISKSSKMTSNDLNVLGKLGETPRIVMVGGGYLRVTQVKID